MKLKSLDKVAHFLLQKNTIATTELLLLKKKLNKAELKNKDKVKFLNNVLISHENILHITAVIMSAATHSDNIYSDETLEQMSIEQLGKELGVSDKLKKVEDDSIAEMSGSKVEPKKGRFDNIPDDIKSKVQEFADKMDAKVVVIKSGEGLSGLKDALNEIVKTKEGK